jgi:hypothetical protein
MVNLLGYNAPAMWDESIIEAKYVISTPKEPPPKRLLWSITRF